LYIPDDGLGFKGRNVGCCQQLINFIDDKSTDGWTMSNNTNTTIIPFCGPTKQVLVKRYHNKGLCANQPLALAGVALAFKSYLWS